MSRSRRSAGASRSCATAVALYALCTTAVCLGGGEDPPGGDPDGSVPMAGLGVHLATSEDDVEVALARGGITELRARNDRGGDLEPRMEDVGGVEFADGATVDFGSVPPATYGRITMRLEEGDWGPALELRLVGLDGSATLVLRDEVDVDARCELPVLLAPGSEATLELSLEVDELWEALPEPPSGGEDRVIDAETDPEALAAVERALPDAWSLECDAESSDGHSESLEEEEDGGTD